LKTEMSKEELDKLRIGWDLIIDIDSKYLEYNKIAAELLVEALKFHNIKNMGVKFSGGTGFHVGLSFKAFPKKIQSLNIKDFFPEGPRLIASYLKEMIKKPLSERILSLNSLSEIATSLKKPEEEFIVDGQFDPFTIVSIDTILISSRHLFRMPYSLHEKTKLASVVIKPEQIKEFHIGWAKPSRVFPRVFLPEPEKDEARELLTQALDWKARRKSEEKEKEKIESKFEQIKIENITDDLFPKCIRNILEGIKKDGRKRALFVLITFFRSLHMDENIIEKRIFEWNLKNYRPLKEGYIKAQLDWFKKQKRILPPNCDNDSYYKDLGVCENDSCRNIKNPVNYVLRQIRINEAREYNSKRGRKRKNI